MFRIAALFLVVLVAGLPPAARAFHALDCGPFRPTVIDKKTGERTCLEPTPGARGQFLRFRKLQQEQQRRTRDLLLQQRQRAKAQEILDTQERNRQLQFNRRHTLNQREPGRNQDRTVKVQESLGRQNLEAQMLRERVLENTLSRRRNLL
jgi:hypothetical protein